MEDGLIIIVPALPGKIARRERKIMIYNQ